MTIEQKEHRMEYQRRAMQKRRQCPEYMKQFRVYYNDWRRNAKEPCINMYSNGDACCAWCPQSDLDVLCLDHIDEGKTKEFTKEFGHRGGQYLYAKLRKLGYPPGFQVLCANCNMKKEIIRRRMKRVAHGY